MYNAKICKCNARKWKKVRFFILLILLHLTFLQSYNFQKSHQNDRKGFLFGVGKSLLIIIIFSHNIKVYISHIYFLKVIDVFYLTSNRNFAHAMQLLTPCVLVLG